MAPLASISETPSRRSTIESPIPQRRVAFQRSRPKCRVIVVSRGPSRVQQRDRYTIPSGAPETFHRETIRALTASEDGLSSRYLSLPPPALKTLISQAEWCGELVSPLNSPTSSTYDHSDATDDKSIDLDSFPMPPNRGKGWPLPDDQRLPSPAKQARAEKAAKQPQKNSPPNTRQGNQHVELPPKRRPPEPPEPPVQKPPREPSESREPQHQSAVDEVLVDAISKGVAKQLRLFSYSSSKTSARQNRKQSTESRTPSQREALDRFTKELKRHADKVGAKGKVPVFTPTPAMSPITLRTVSALVPYRPEFRAAGLAVTSKDQAQRCPITAKENTISPPRQRRQPPKEAQQSQVTQMDGKQESETKQSTIIDFTGSKDVES